MADELTCAEAVRRMREDGHVIVPIDDGDRLVVARETGDEERVWLDDYIMTKDRARVLASALIDQDVEAMQAVVAAAVTLTQATAREHREAVDGLHTAVERYDTGAGNGQ